MKVKNKKINNQIKKIKKILTPNNSNIMLCDVCRHEIFNFWTYDKKIICINCFEK